MSDPSEMTPKHAALIAALLTEPTVAAAAEKVGIGSATAYRWMKKPAFRKEWARAKDRIVNAALDRLELVTAKAVAALERNLDCQDPSVETRAAVAVLNQTLKVKDLRELEKEVKELTKIVRQNAI